YIPLLRFHNALKFFQRYPSFSPAWIHILPLRTGRFEYDRSFPECPKLLSGYRFPGLTDLHGTNRSFPNHLTALSIRLIKESAAVPYWRSALIEYYSGLQ